MERGLSLGPGRAGGKAQGGVGGEAMHIRWSPCHAALRCSHTRAGAQRPTSARPLQDGFIHLTKEPSLLLTVANHFYKGVPGDWLVLCIDSSKRSAKRAAPSGPSAGISRVLDQPGSGALASTVIPCQRHVANPET